MRGGGARGGGGREGVGGLRSGAGRGGGRQREREGVARVSKAEVARIHDTEQLCAVGAVAADGEWQDRPAGAAGAGRGAAGVGSGLRCPAGRGGATSSRRLGRGVGNNRGWSGGQLFRDGWALVADDPRARQAPGSL